MGTGTPAIPHYLKLRGNFSNNCAFLGSRYMSLLVPEERVICRPRRTELNYFGCDSFSGPQRSHRYSRFCDKGHGRAGSAQWGKERSNNCGNRGRQKRGEIKGRKVCWGWSPTWIVGVRRRIARTVSGGPKIRHDFASSLGPTFKLLLFEQ